MTLSSEAVSEFKAIYTKQFGEKLTNLEAEQKALAMLRLFRMIYSKSAPKDWANKYEKKQNIRS